MKAAQAAAPFVLRLSVACASSVSWRLQRGRCTSGIRARAGIRSLSLASCRLLLLSAPGRQVSVCQQKVTFGMAMRVTVHMFRDTPCYQASRSDFSLARAYKIVSLADCQKLHHIGVNCF